MFGTPGNIIKCAKDIRDDLEFIAEADFGIEVVEYIPGQGRATQGVGMGHSVLSCQVDQQRRARRRAQNVVPTHMNLTWPNLIDRSHHMRHPDAARLREHVASSAIFRASRFTASGVDECGTWPAPSNAGRTEACACVCGHDWTLRSVRACVSGATRIEVRKQRALHNS